MVNFKAIGGDHPISTVVEERTFDLIPLFIKHSHYIRLISSS